MNLLRSGSHEKWSKNFNGQSNGDVSLKILGLSLSLLELCMMIPNRNAFGILYICNFMSVSDSLCAVIRVSFTENLEICLLKKHFKCKRCLS